MTTHSSQPGTTRFWTPRRIVAAALTVLVLAFVLQNRGDVTLQLLGIRISSPVWFAAIVMLGLGMAIGVLVSDRRRQP